MRRSTVLKYRERVAAKADENNRPPVEVQHTTRRSGRGGGKRDVIPVEEVMVEEVMVEEVMVEEVTVEEEVVMPRRRSNSAKKGKKRAVALEEEAPTPPRVRAVEREAKEGSRGGRFVEETVLPMEVDEAGEEDSDDDFETSRVSQGRAAPAPIQTPAQGPVVQSSSAVKAPGSISSNASTMPRNTGIDREERNSESLLAASQGESEVSRFEDDVFSEIDGGGEKYDQNDPQWIRFLASVKESSGNAPGLLASALVEAGTNCSALLGKLSYRVTNPQTGIPGFNKEIQEKCATTILRSVLHLTVHHDSSSTGVVVDVVNMMFMELRHFPTSILYNIVEHCLEYMKNEKEGPLPPRWIEIFGKIVAVLVGRGDIKHETDVLDGKAYRQHIINEICRVKWTSENTASVIAVLKEIPDIEATELKIIVQRLRSCIKGIKPSSLPPIIHQLLLLAGSRSSLELLYVCSEYFGDINFSDTSSLEVRQKRNALGTVVYHFLEAARHCNVVVKAVITIVKASFFDFGRVMNPFMLSVALGLTTFDHARSLIIDPLRSSVIRSFYSMHLSQMSYWYRITVDDSKDAVTECFKAVLEGKSSELEFMFDGLRELGIGLLNADSYQSRYPNTLQKCRELGYYLITSIVKTCPDQLPEMMKYLLRVSSKSIVHNECLATCLEMRTRQVIHSSVIGRTCEIIRSLSLMDSESAGLIVKALSTAFQLCYTLLDQLMLHLRKTIWKSVEARKTAAKIMIILLSNSRVVGDVPFSQFSESQRLNNSEPTTLNSGQLPDNQPLCMEILTLTKRCFSQQCEIRKELYLGLYSVVRKNPALCELICSQLYSHANQYIIESGESSLQVLLTKTVEASESSQLNPIIIKEELGFLIQCLCFVVHQSHLAFDKLNEQPPAAVEQLETLLNKYVSALLLVTQDNIETAAAQVVGDSDGAKPLDVVRYVETIFVFQILQIIEALIEFLNFETSNKHAKTVKKLFDKMKALEPMLKREKEKASGKKGKTDKANKGKGGDKINKDNSNDDTVADSASETSENQPQVKFKRPDAPKRLVYHHILNLESCVDILQKLFGSERDRAAVTQVKANKEFERFVLDTVKQKLTNFKQKESLNERSRHRNKIAQTFADVAGALWNGILVNPSAGNASDSILDDATRETSVEMMEVRLEVISMIVEHLCREYPSSWCYMIKLFGDEPSDDVTFDEVFPKFFNSWKSVLQWIRTGSEEEKKVHQHLFEILQYFGHPLSPDTQQRSQAGEILSWIWGYMSKAPSGVPTAEFMLAEAVVSCWLDYYRKAKGVLEQPGLRQHDLLSMAQSVRFIFGDDEELPSGMLESTEKRLWIVNSDTTPTIFCLIMNYIEDLITHMTAMLTKLKSHQPMSAADSTKDNVVEIRESCFRMVNQILLVSSELVVSAFPSGLCVTTMLKVIPQIFTLMTGFANYFLELSKTKQEYSIKGFAGPVSRIGKEFKVLVETMISHIERIQRQFAEEVTTKSANNKKSKAAGKIPAALKYQLMKEKKLIPQLVYSIEKYDQEIIALSNKKKDQKGIRLLVGMKLSTARDFKIDSEKLSDALESNRPRTVQEMTTVPDDTTGVEGNDENDEEQHLPVPPKERTRKGRKRKSPADTDN